MTDTTPTVVHIPVTQKGDAPEAAAASEDRRGGYFSSLFTVFNSILGTGILTLPYSMAKAGAVPAFVILVVYGVLMCGTAYITASVAHNTGCRTMPSILRHLIGSKAGLASNAAVAMYAFFLCASSLVIVADIAGPLLDAWIPHPTSTLAKMATSRETHIVMAALCALPAMLMKDFTALRFTALTAFVCLMFVTVVVVAYYCMHGVTVPVTPAPVALNGTGAAHVNDDEGVELWPSSYRLIYAIPNIALALVCHTQIPGIYSELNNAVRTPGYFSKVLAPAYAIPLTMYGCVMAFGYATFLGATMPNIMQGGYNTSDPLIMVARMALVLTAVCTIPVNHHPCRAALKDLYDAWCARSAEATPLVADERPAADQHRRFYAVELASVWVVMIITASVVPNLSILCSVTNFAAGVPIMFIFPGLMLVHVPAYEDAYISRRAFKPLGWFFIVWGVLTSIIAFVSFVLATMDKTP